jgi:hypothetical protein
MRVITTRDLYASAQALRFLVDEFPSLPAPMVSMTDLFPDRLNLHFYDGLGAFEAWREALSLKPEAVKGDAVEDGEMMRLTAEVPYEAVTVCLSAYAPLPSAARGTEVAA